MFNAASSICKLFNKLLEQGVVLQESVTSCWNLANVVPIYKRGDKEHAENYRPISLLPIILKIFERSIFLNIRHQFSWVINDHQNGFLQRKSCVTGLLE